jgi:glycine/D-amino acid oxidase-like deaminating enzyme
MNRRKELHAAAKSAKEAGIRCTLLDADETRHVERQLTPDVSAGLLIPDHGFVVAGDLCY